MSEQSCAPTLEHIKGAIERIECAQTIALIMLKDESCAPVLRESFEVCIDASGRTHFDWTPISEILYDDKVMRTNEPSDCVMIVFPELPRIGQHLITFKFRRIGREVIFTRGLGSAG